MVLQKFVQVCSLNSPRMAALVQLLYIQSALHLLLGSLLSPLLLLLPSLLLPSLPLLPPPMLPMLLLPQLLLPSSLLCKR
jgi:hypothetical protein